MQAWLIAARRRVAVVCVSAPGCALAVTVQCDTSRLGWRTCYGNEEPCQLAGRSWPRPHGHVSVGRARLPSALSKCNGEPCQCAGHSWARPHVHVLFGAFALGARPQLATVAALQPLKPKSWTELRSPASSFEQGLELGFFHLSHCVPWECCDNAQSLGQLQK